MDVQALRYLKAVVETGSITRGAAVLRITPGALSKSIKRIEASVGKPLVVSDGRGIRTTDEARRIATLATPVITAFDELNAQLQLPSDAHAESLRPALRIATSEHFSTHFLATIHPKHLRNIELELIELPPGEIEQALLERSADVGVSSIPVPTTGVIAELIARTSASLWGQERFAGHAIDEVPFIVPDVSLHGRSTQAREIDGWTVGLPRRRVAARVTLLESALALCRSGLGVALISDYIADAHNRTVLPSRRLHRLRASSMLGPAAWKNVFVLRRFDQDAAIVPPWLTNALRALAT